MLGDLNYRRENAKPISHSASSPLSFILPPELVAKRAA